MNRTYRLVWNEETQSRVPAPESARGRGKSCGRTLKPAALLLAAAFAAPAFAQTTPPAPTTLPTGGQVVAGQAGIAQSGAAMTVSQGSERAIINWQGFDIGSQASVRFQQPSSSAVALNRVIAGDASQIHGQLSANGQVWLVNPAGIVFGAGSRVDVGGLVASTLDSTNEDFMAGKAVFSRNGATGGIENHGEITAADGGLVALLAPTVKNEGIVRARLGTVAFAAGERIALEAGADGLLHVALDPATVRTLIENKQLIVADGGQVIMTSKAADALAAGVVANPGTVQARTVAKRAGRILLLADMEHGEVIHSGLLDASAPEGGDGGFVETSAAKVTLEAGRKVTTRAENGETGTWLVDPNDYTIAASDGDITGTDLSTDLASNNVEIQSSAGGKAGKGDIQVNDAVSWSANTLTLTAASDININAVMTASGASKLVMNPGTANGGDAAVTGGVVKVGFNSDGTFKGRVDFPGRSGTGFLTINGAGYTVINSLGAANSTTGADLQGMRGNLAGKYALGANIDASATSGWNGNAGFVPIGSGSSPFAGIFDGLGHTITNLSINRSGTSYVGLFGRVKGGKVMNIGLPGGAVRGADYVGWLAGHIDGGVITNAYATGTLNGTAYVGGLVGRNDGGAIGNAYAAVTITGTREIGGLVGYNDGAVTNSHYSIDDVSINGRSLVTLGGLYSGQYTDWFNGRLVPLNISDYSSSLAPAGANTYTIGSVQGMKDLLAFADDPAFTFRLSADIDLDGVAGYNVPWLKADFDGDDHTFSNIEVDLPNSRVGLFSYLAPDATVSNLGALDAQVSGLNYVGGLAGWNHGDISNAHATGAINGTSRVGGLVGGNYGNISNAYATATVSGANEVGGLAGGNYNAINNAHATGAVSGSGSIGGLVGGNYGDISNVYAIGTVNGTGYGIGGLVGINEGNIIDAHATGEVNGTGGVGGLVGDNDKGAITVAHATGKVTGGFAIGGLAGYNYGTITDAYATGVINGWDWVGGLVGYNGSGGTITSAYATGAVSDIGLINYVEDGIGGLAGYNDGTVIDVHATGAVSGYFNIGGLIGRNGGAITNAYATGEVDGNHNVGGLTGRNEGAIADAYATGRVSGNFNLGGLAGYNDKGSITNVYATGEVSGDGEVVGGLVGDNYKGAITNAFAIGKVSGDYYVGGLAGNNDGTISNAYAIGEVSGNYYVGGLVGKNVANIKDAYSTGMVTGGDYIGGLVGGNQGNITSAYAAGAITASGSNVGGLVGHTYSAVTNSYWNITTSMRSASAGGTGLTTVEMMSLASFGGWNISATGGETTVWRIYEGKTYPLLRSFLTPLTITANDASKTYDGQAYSGGNGITCSPGICPGSNLFDINNFTGTSQTAVNVGSYTLIPDVYSNQQSYDIVSVSGTLTINKASLTLSGGFTVNEKTYDGTTAAIINLGHTLALGGIISGDDVAASWSASFADKNVGTDKTVTLAAPVLVGEHSGNYSVDQGTTPTASANIIPATLIIGAHDITRVYDGTTDATGTAIAVAGTQLFDDDTLSGGSFAFDNKHAGTGKTVTVSGVTVNDGNSGGNYVVSYAANTNSIITPAPLTVTANNHDKTYDGSPYSGGNGVDYSGFVTGEDSNVLDGTLAYGGTSQGARNAGGYAISPSGLTSGNYAITFADGTLTIDKASLTLSAATDTKVYDGGTTSAVPVTVAGLMPGDAITGLTQSFESKDVKGDDGSVLSVDAGYSLDDGNGGGNYNVTAQTAQGTITPASLTIGAHDLSRLYGDANPVLTATAVGWKGEDGDSLVTGLTTGATTSSGVGDYTIDASSVSAGINYTVTGHTNGTLAVTPAPLTIKANDASKTHGQTLTFTGTEFIPTGLKNGETIGSVTLASAGATAAASVGAYGITTSDATGGSFDAGNYLIAYVDGTLTVGQTPPPPPPPVPATLSAADLLRAAEVARMSRLLSRPEAGLESARHSIATFSFLTLAPDFIRIGSGAKQE